MRTSPWLSTSMNGDRNFDVEKFQLQDRLLLSFPPLRKRIVGVRSKIFNLGSLNLRGQRTKALNQRLRGFALLARMVIVLTLSFVSLGVCGERRTHGQARLEVGSVSVDRVRFAAVEALWAMFATMRHSFDFWIIGKKLPSRIAEAA